MAKHDSINARVKAEQERTGKNLIGKAAPKPVKRGGSDFVTETSSAVIQKKPTAVINVIRGSETREKVERALSPKDHKQGFQKL